MRIMKQINETVYTLTGKNLGESAKAVKFRINQIGTDTLVSPKIEWFPFSQVSKMYKHDNQAEDGNDYIIVSKWIMDQKKMFPYVVKGAPITPNSYTEEDNLTDDWLNERNNQDEEEDDIFF